MQRALILVVLLAVGALLADQVRRLRRDATGRRAARAGALDAALGLLAAPRLQIEPHGFPRLAGLHRGAAVDLRLVPDTLAIRKLPALWLLATLTEPQPLAATWHLMLRPRGAETFSGWGALPSDAPLPDGLPEDAGLRTDADRAPVPVAVARAMAEAVAALGAARLKEVVLSPRGLRLTWLAEEADRTRYLLFRDAEMGRAPVPEADVAALLAALLDLRAALAAEPERRRA